MTLFIIGILLSLVIVVLIYQTISKRYNIIEDMNKEGFTFDIKGNTKRREGEINDLMKLTNYNKTSVDNELMAQNNPDIDNFPVLEKNQFIDQIKNAEIIDNSISDLKNKKNINTKSSIYNPLYKLIKKPMSTVESSALKELIDRCNLVKSCDELDAVNNGSGLENYKCGYCANSGKYLVVNSKTLDESGKLLPKYKNKTMQTDVCLQGNGIKDYGISLNNEMCKENKDFKVCDDADGGKLNESPSLKCEKLTGESEGKCGWCPISNKLIPMEKVNGKELPKYPSSQFNQQGGCTNLLEGTTFVVPSNKCIEYIDNNPCVGTTSSTGPHNQKCVEQQWKTTGCPVENIGGKTFAQFSKQWGSGSGKDYISMKKSFHKMTKENLNSKNYDESNNAHILCYGKDKITYNHDHKMNKEGFSSMDGVLKKINLNSCDYSKYDPNSTCARNILEVLGCKSDKPDSAYQKISNHKSDWGRGVQPWVNKINRVKNTIAVSKKYDDKKAAAKWCGTPIPPPPPPMKIGDIVVTQDDTHEGVVMEDKGDRIRVMWVRYKDKNRYTLDNTKESDIQTQRDYFGWPDMKAEKSPFSNSEMTDDGRILKSIFNLYDVKRCTASGSCANCEYNVQRMRDLFPKPRDCKVENWRITQPCPSGCIEFDKNKKLYDYEQVRERGILVKPFAGGKKCPPLREVKKCMRIKSNFKYCENNVSNAGLNQSLSEVEMKDEGPYFKDGNKYLKCPAKEYGKTDCWSNGGRKKWCRNQSPDAETPYKRWACNNCNECKGDSKAGGPWQPYRGPSRDIVKPVVCATSVNVPAKSSERDVKNYCNNYHKTLEAQKAHTRNGGCSCKPYKADNIKKNAGAVTNWYWKNTGSWLFPSYRKVYYTKYTMWTGKCVLR